jgi:hypothetical protein
LLYGTRYTDLCYGYNAFWASSLRHLNIDCQGFEVETLINVRIARAGLLTKEVASVERTRQHGESNLSAWRDGRAVLRTIARERVRRRGRQQRWSQRARRETVAPVGLELVVESAR